MNATERKRADELDFTVHVSSPSSDNERMRELIVLGARIERSADAPPLAQEMAAPEAVTADSAD